MFEETLSYFSHALVWLGVAFFTYKRLPQFLRFLQQEEYTISRFLDWVWEYKFFDRKGTLVLLAASFAFYLFSSLTILFIASVVTSLSLLAVVIREPNPETEGKITLKMTKRANRINRLALFIALFVLTAISIFAVTIGGAEGLLRLSLASLFYIHMTPLLLCLSVFLLQPGERRIQKKFSDQAKSKYREIAPFTIGITGSYGKTSTKNMLARILDSAVGPTFWPQKGVNTPMGITREIRERLQENQKHSVVEMGAYRPGSISRLCELTPPNAGIITAVGIMHLERMGGVEGVLRAKSELAQAIPDDGILVCNADNRGALKISQLYPKQTTLLYSLGEYKDADATMSVDGIEKSGTQFTIDWKGQRHSGFTKLHGEASLSNLLASFVMACAIGAKPENVLAAIRNIEPVNNRLEVVRVGDGIQINDAYNSNPDGFASALNVLSELEGGRRILVTPGMIDLGDQEYDQNKQLAKMAAGICDEVYIVGQVNRKAILQGLAEGNFEESKIKQFSSRNGALEALAKDRQPADIVLIENDLPDLFELDVAL